MAKLGLGGNTQQEPTAPQTYTQQPARRLNRFNNPNVCFRGANSVSEFQQPAQQPAQYQAPAQPAAPAPAPTTRGTKPQHQTQPQPQAQMPNFPPMEEDDLPF